MNESTRALIEGQPYLSDEIVETMIARAVTPPEQKLPRFSGVTFVLWLRMLARRA